MRPITTTYSFTGLNAQVVQTPIPFDYFKNPFNVSIAVVLGSGASSTYSIEHTFDDIYSSTYSAATGNWFPHDQSTFSGATTSGNGNFAYPTTAARLKTSSTTSGPVTVTYIQAG